MPEARRARQLRTSALGDRATLGDTYTKVQ
jgi:hypothetical protein